MFQFCARSRMGCSKCPNRDSLASPAPSSWLIASIVLCSVLCEMLSEAACNRHEWSTRRRLVFFFKRKSIFEAQTSPANSKTTKGNTWSPDTLMMLRGCQTRGGCGREKRTSKTIRPLASQLPLAIKSVLD
jgi:hypothetical protein